MISKISNETFGWSQFVIFFILGYVQTFYRFFVGTACSFFDGKHTHTHRIFDPWSRIWIYLVLLCPSESLGRSHRHTHASELARSRMGFSCRLNLPQQFIEDYDGYTLLLRPGEREEKCLTGYTQERKIVWEMHEVVRRCRSRSP